MSTESQCYSTANQADAIKAYAEARSYALVRTYADEGKSGLTLNRREGLRRLLADVTSGQADFSIVLVYDVSRWGRFQDTDESAYYEYLCKRAGVRVEYCAELFENDGSIGSDIQKVLKRRMAAEFSRELSVKTFAGQRRQIELGFRQGGTAGYGPRRALVDASRQPKASLNRGEQKYLKSDHVVLVPGTHAEKNVVKRIFNLFTEHGKTEREIALILNAQGISAELGRSWTRQAVRGVIEGEKYIGNNTWNRNSQKLKGTYVRNPPSLWIRAEGVFPALVDRKRFEKAQNILLDRKQRLSEGVMLDMLRQLLEKRGRLSRRSIDASDLPNSTTYVRRFGTLRRAYSLIGYTQDVDLCFLDWVKRARLRYPLLVTEILERSKVVGANIALDPDTGLLMINDEITARLILSRCKANPSGTLRWAIRFPAMSSDLTIIARLSSNEADILDYYILPSAFIRLKKLTLSIRNEIELDAYRFDDLGALCDVVRRVSVRKLA
jgi:DNA invertase Pin-like site-specific DNA recombinase